MNRFEGMLLACDMDGTLLDSTRQISDANLQALRYFTAEGGRFSLATGRAFAAVTEYLDVLPINAPYCLLNGSLVMDAAHRPLHCAGMPMQTRHLIKDVLASFPRVGCEVFLPEQILICRMSEETEHHMRVLHLEYSHCPVGSLPPETGWCQINFTGTAEEVASVRTFLTPFSNIFSAVCTMPTFCEVTRCGIGKGSAITQIADDCGIRTKRIYAVGDSDNDLSMLTSAAVSFAPANAAPDILQHVTVSVRDNDHDAVADVIEYLSKYITA